MMRVALFSLQLKSTAFRDAIVYDLCNYKRTKKITVSVLIVSR